MYEKKEDEYWIKQSRETVPELKKKLFRHIKTTAHNPYSHTHTHTNIRPFNGETEQTLSPLLQMNVNIQDNNRHTQTQTKKCSFTQTLEIITEQRKNRMRRRKRKKKKTEEKNKFKRNCVLLIQLKSMKLWSALYRFSFEKRGKKNKI